jgi:replicative DNA helicase
MSQTNSLLHYETALIATLLLRPSAIPEVDLTPDEFTDERLGTIYRTIQDLFAAAEETDAVTVMDALEREGKRGIGNFAVQLATEGMTTASPAVYAEQIRVQAQFRQASDIARSLMAAAQSREPTCVDEAIAQLMDLHRTEKRFEFTAKAAANAAFQEISAVIQSGGKLRGITTGVDRLDDRLGGWHGGDLTIVGARPSMGKTALLVHFARCAMEGGHSIGMISAEQPAMQIAQRHMAMGGRVDASRLRAGKLEDEEWNRVTGAIAQIASSRYWLYDRSAPSLSEVVRIARKWKHAHGIELLLVDYVQRIRDESSEAPRWERVGNVARGLKNLARDLDIPVVALAQVNRAVEQRADQRPRMGDLADSSELEKEADAILMLYRDDVARPDAKDRQQGIAELLLEKNRHGPTGRVKMAFVAQTMRFENLADERDESMAGAA